jgi:hypothetical protein
MCGCVVPQEELAERLEAQRELRKEEQELQAAQATLDASLQVQRQQDLEIQELLQVLTAALLLPHGYELRTQYLDTISRVRSSYKVFCTFFLGALTGIFFLRV